MNEPTYYTLNQILLTLFVNVIRGKYGNPESQSWQKVFYVAGKLPPVINESLLEIIKYEGINIDDLEKLEDYDKEVVDLVSQIFTCSDDYSFTNIEGLQDALPFPIGEGFPNGLAILVLLEPASDLAAEQQQKYRAALKNLLLIFKLKDSEGVDYRMDDPQPFIELIEGVMNALAERNQKSKKELKRLFTTEKIYNETFSLSPKEFEQIWILISLFGAIKASEEETLNFLKSKLAEGYIVAYGYPVPLKATSKRIAIPANHWEADLLKLNPLTRAAEGDNYKYVDLNFTFRKAANLKKQGEAGRPSMMNVIAQQMQKRFDEGKLLKVFARETRALEEWANKEYPKIRPLEEVVIKVPDAKSIAKNEKIKALYYKLNPNLKG